jgi:SCY1-like protein 2
VTVTENGSTEVKASPSLTNGIHSAPTTSGGLGKPAQIPSAKGTSAWDEDWGPTKKTSAPSLSVDSSLQIKQPSLHPFDFSTQTTQSTTLPFDFSTPSNQPSTVSQVPAVTIPPAQPLPSLKSLALTSGSQNSDSCVPVDIEWPPQTNSLSNFNAPSVNKESDSRRLSSDGLDDIDPFANWPPKPSSATGISGMEFPSSTSQSFSGSNTGNIGLGGSSSSLGQMKSNQMSWSAKPNTSNLMGLNSIGSYMNQGNSALGFGNPIGGLGTGLSYQSSSSAGQSMVQPKSDFGSLSLPSNSDSHGPPRLAPPPSAAVGRGRGRNQGQSALSRASRPPNSNSSSGQQPILDLLQ